MVTIVPLSQASSWFLQNTFAEKLGPLGLDSYNMLVVDILHEVELGVWKALFTHLIRILYAAAPGGKLVSELNRRYVHLLIHTM